MMYEVTGGYWNYGSHVVAVTDDIMYARSFLLEYAAKTSGMTMDEFMCFEDLFKRFKENTDRSLYFSIRDHHFSIREAQQKVAVGGMATL